MQIQHKQRGVTLIELVVVMIVVAILAAVAVPSYRNYVLRSQRSDAKEALLALATQQEKFYLQCNIYAGNIANAVNCGASQLQGAATSENGWYQLAVGAPDAPLTLATGYVATAVAVNGEQQFQDTECRTFQVNHAGVRQAFDANDADNTAECWR